MPCIEEAWNFPISQEMASRQSQERLKNSQLVSSDQPQKKARLDSTPQGTTPTQPPYLTDSQIAHMNQMQQVQFQLNPQQKSYLRNLQHQYQLMIQHQNNQKHNNGQQINSHNVQAQSQIHAAPVIGETAESQNPSQIPRIGTCQSNPQSTSDSANSSKLVSTYITEGDLQTLLSPRQSAASIAEDLINEFGLSSRTVQSTANFQSSLMPSAKNILPPPNRSGLQAVSSIISAERSSQARPSLSIDMSATEILEKCKGLGSSGHIETNVLLDESMPPSPPEPPYPPCPKEKLLPPTPSVFVRQFMDKRNTNVFLFL